MPRPFNPDNAHTYPTATGVDEVGRGCLASCVLVAAVWFDPSDIPAGLLGALDDSKRLTAQKRNVLAIEIRKHCLFAFAASSPKLIERLNIRGATLDAMRRAVQKLAVVSDVYIDGRDVPPGIVNAQAVVKGDQVVPQIAAASIIAKSLRDDLMVSLAHRHPAYGWEHNAGYGTSHHIAALREVGITAHHRTGFLANLLSSDC